MAIDLLDLLKAIFLGIVEGVTEWLPISSTGHMILVDEFLPLNMSAAYKEMFFVVIQLGAILAVIVNYWNQLIPFTVKGGLSWKKDTLSMWYKIVFACIPAGIYAVTLDEKVNTMFYSYQMVSVMLILVGIVFLVIEGINKGKTPTITKISELTYRTAFIIGIFQLIAGVFPGTSRSGATIIGALLIGVSRVTAAEFTFFLAIPTMLGASLLKLVKFGFDFTSDELITLVVGMAVAFVVSLAAIRFLMSYVKKHDFKFFGWYRIVLGVLVLLIFALR
ncbi:undecaprenyl-diphosphate phosphatase [Gorillibacterium sp. CAU 1737]|uniref:undecaprenyl-diphosphate phosphatase n=1 Tax=Gorillibacterium sp. CAU 1737 TaxID=3140362 RepID=UPI003261A531